MENRTQNESLERSSPRTFFALILGNGRSNSMLASRNFAPETSRDVLDTIRSEAKDCFGRICHREPLHFFSSFVWSFIYGLKVPQFTRNFEFKSWWQKPKRALLTLLTSASAWLSLLLLKYELNLLPGGKLQLLSGNTLRLRPIHFCQFYGHLRCHIGGLEWLCYPHRTLSRTSSLFVPMIRVMTRDQLGLVFWVSNLGQFWA